MKKIFLVLAIGLFYTAQAVGIGLYDPAKDEFYCAPPLTASNGVLVRFWVAYGQTQIFGNCFSAFDGAKSCSFDDNKIKNITAKAVLLSTVASCLSKE